LHFPSAFGTIPSFKKYMPNITAAKKSMRADKKKRSFNDRRRRAMKETVKAYKALIAEGKTAEAQEMVAPLYKSIDKATKRGVLKKNTASRKKSRLVAMLKRAKTAA
jgi:small subunit ribosomal protein S20